MDSNIGTTTLIDKLMAIDANDYGNAEAFKLLCPDRFLYCPKIGWMQYTGTHWRSENVYIDIEIANSLRARNKAAEERDNQRIMRATEANMRPITGCKTLLQSMLYTAIDEFDGEKHLLNCKNAVVDLRTGELIPHNSSQRFTYCLEWEYDTTADFSKWVQFLESTVEGGMEVVQFLQMAVGYSCSGETLEDMSFYIQGPGRSGKGTFSETLLRLLGESLSTEADFNTFTKRDGSNNFDLARLKQKRLVFASESNKTQTLNTAKTKHMTGGNKITTSFKGKDDFAYDPQFKVWLVSNHEINADAIDDALWSRQCVIRFPHSHIGTENPTVKQSMKAEGNMKAVLKWVVEGAIAWYARDINKKMPIPEILKNATKESRNLANSLEQWFNDCFAIDKASDKKNWVKGIDLITNCKLWHSDNLFPTPHPKSIREFILSKGLEYNKVIRITSDTQSYTDSMISEIKNGGSKTKKCCPYVIQISMEYEERANLRRNGSGSGYAYGKDQ